MKRASLFALLAAVLTALASLSTTAAQGDPLNWKMTLSAILTAALVAIGQVFTPSAYNNLTKQGANFAQLSFAKKKSFGWGGLLNGALTAGAQIATGGGVKQALPIILTSVLAAATGGAATISEPDPPRPRSRGTLTHWPED
jgi:hypothetical protein